MVLPTLGPAVEELLHFVHESGELQRMLRAEQESAQREKAAAAQPTSRRRSQVTA